MAGPNRYSTLVSWAKVVLPLMALALLSTLFLFSRTPNPDDALPFADVDVEQLVSEQRLSRPRFAGTLEDGRPVTLSADSATQQGAEPNTLLLSTVEADVALSADTSLQLSADTGEFDLPRQIIDLAGAVTILTTSGYRLASDRISVALDTLRLASPGAVTLSGSGLTLEAGAMELTGGEGQALFSFTGGVRLLYVPRD
jgi:lipopolysaccharide export system protein LptC